MDDADAYLAQQREKLAQVRLAARPPVDSHLAGVGCGLGDGLRRGATADIASLARARVCRWRRRSRWQK